jgi:hypothetical protein
MRLQGPPPGLQEEVSSVPYRKAPSDVVAWNFLVLSHVEQLKHKEQ